MVISRYGVSSIICLAIKTDCITLSLYHHYWWPKVPRGVLQAVVGRCWRSHKKRAHQINNVILYSWCSWWGFAGSVEQEKAHQSETICMSHHRVFLSLGTFHPLCHRIHSHHNPSSACVDCTSGWRRRRRGSIWYFGKHSCSTALCCIVMLVGRGQRHDIMNSDYITLSQGSMFNNSDYKL